MSDLYRQLGETVATMRSLGADMQEVKRSLREDLSDVKKTIETIRSQQIDAQRDREAQQRIVTEQIVKLRDLGEERHKANTDRLDKVQADIAEMKRPVSEFVSMKKRASAFVMVAVAVSGVLWTLAEPLYRFFVMKVFNLPG